MPLCQRPPQITPKHQIAQEALRTSPPGPRFCGTSATFAGRTNRQRGGAVRSMPALPGAPNASSAASSFAHASQASLLSDSRSSSRRAGLSLDELQESVCIPPECQPAPALVPRVRGSSRHNRLARAISAARQDTPEHRTQTAPRRGESARHRVAANRRSVHPKPASRTFSADLHWLTASLPAARD